MSYLVFHLRHITHIPVVHKHGIRLFGIDAQLSGRDGLPPLCEVGVYLGPLQNVVLSIRLSMDTIKKIVFQLSISLLRTQLSKQ